LETLVISNDHKSFTRVEVNRHDIKIKHIKIDPCKTCSWILPDTCRACLLRKDYEKDN
jgi:hypothetical protein